MKKIIQLTLSQYSVYSFFSCSTFITSPVKLISRKELTWSFIRTPFLYIALIRRRSLLWPLSPKILLMRVFLYTKGCHSINKLFGNDSFLNLEDLYFGFSLLTHSHIANIVDFSTTTFGSISNRENLLSVLFWHSLELQHLTHTHRDQIFRGRKGHKNQFWVYV